MEARLTCRLMCCRRSAFTPSADMHCLVLPQINDCSSVLRCYMGMALAKLNRHQEAVKMLRTAIQADPNNPLARFELASVLVAIEHFDEGLEELEALKV